MNKWIKVKNAFINELRALSIAIGLVAGIVILGTIISLVVSEIATSLPDQTVASSAWNVTQLGLNTFQNIFKQTPLLGTILILLVIASAALGIFAFFGGKKKGF